MRVPPQFLDQIRARVSISSVVGRYVQWDRRKSQPSKGSFWACCPFHTEKTPSFHVDDKRGQYYCFGCKASGDVFTFLMEKQGLKFFEAVQQLAGEAGLEVPHVSEDEVKQEETRTSLYDVLELAQSFFQAELQAPRGAKARGYLADRDIQPAVQQAFGIGYAPDDRSALRTFLADKGVSVPQMAEAGLVVAGDDVPVAYDRFRDRVMFPIRDPRGKVVAFGGRALRADVPAKYLNSPETALFQKGELLYNYDKARAPAHQNGRIIVVEGYVDVIAMHRAGLMEAVAPLGTALTERQLAILWRSAPEPILCFDGDSAGLKAAYRALDMALPLLKPGLSLRFAFLPGGKDPDDLLRSEGAEALKAVVAKAEAMADVLWRRALSENDRSSPERRAAFERDLRVMVSGIADEGVRRHYLDDLRDRFDGLRRRGQGDWRRQRPEFRPAQAVGRGGLRGNRWQPAWSVPMPASPQLRQAVSTEASENALHRRAEMIVLAMVNHPHLLHEFWDDIAALELPRSPVESLRAEIIDYAASADGEELAPDRLRHHLTIKGFGDVLGRLESQARRLNEWFLDRAAAADDAQMGVRQMLALHRKTVTLDRALKAAEQAFALDPTDENLSTLVAVREQLLSSQGAEATLEGFGAASGRSSETQV